MAMMMQIHRASLKSISVFWIYAVIKVSCIDTLKQGENLNSSSQLESPNGLFTLRFYTPAGDRTNSSYIAVLFNRGETAPIQIPAVWIGNRDDPLPTNSTPELTLRATGELAITRPGDGGDPIHLFPGGSQNNTTATLLDTGNFVIRSNGREVLWQSYDHPTDTLLSGMKLRVNSRISSWLTPSNPAPGAFTLEWDPTPGELVIRRRGMAYWRSGRLQSYYDKDMENIVGDFENLNFSPDPDNFNYNLTRGGDYFVYDVVSVAGRTMDSRRVASGWRLDWTGNVSTIDDRGMILAMASVCYGYNTGGSVESRGCEVWEQPRCRNGRPVFDLRSGYFRHANQTPATATYDANSSLGLSDCRAACWDNCECAGYGWEDYGCSYWIGKGLKWVQDNAGSTQTKYVLLNPPKGCLAFAIAYLFI